MSGELFNPEAVLQEAVEALCDLGIGIDVVMSKREFSLPLARLMAREYRERDAVKGRVLDETVEDYLYSFSLEQAVAE